MRWLMIAFIVSLLVLLGASAGLAHHIWREHTRRRDARAAAEKAEEAETEDAP